MVKSWRLICFFVTLQWICSSERRLTVIAGTALVLLHSFDGITQGDLVWWVFSFQRFNIWFLIYLFFCCYKKGKGAVIVRALQCRVQGSSQCRIRSKMFPNLWMSALQVGLWTVCRNGASSSRWPSPACWCSVWSGGRLRSGDSWPVWSVMLSWELSQLFIRWSLLRSW